MKKFIENYLNRSDQSTYVLNFCSHILLLSDLIKRYILQKGETLVWASLSLWKIF